MELKQLDFRRSEKYSECMQNYFSLSVECLDVGDYVDKRYLKKIRKILFKEFKFTLRQAKRNYRKAVKSERMQSIKANVKLFMAKFRKKSDAGQ